MRKFKTMLLSAGIAAVLALGGAVGAHLTTNDAPMRTEAAIAENAINLIDYAKLKNDGYTINPAGENYFGKAGGYKVSKTITFVKNNIEEIIGKNGKLHFGMKAFHNGSNPSAPDFQFINAEGTKIGDKYTLSPVFNNGESNANVAEVTAPMVENATGFEVTVYGPKIIILQAGYSFLSSEPSVTINQGTLNVDGEYDYSFDAELSNIELSLNAQYVTNAKYTWSVVSGDSVTLGKDANGTTIQLIPTKGKEGKTTVVNLNVAADNLKKDIKVNLTPIIKTLKSINIDATSSHKTTFILNEPFNTAGLKINTTYVDPIYKPEILENGFTTNKVDTTKLGRQTVSVTYKDKNISYDIFVTNQTLKESTTLSPDDFEEDGYISNYKIAKDDIAFSADKDFGPYGKLTYLQLKSKGTLTIKGIGNNVEKVIVDVHGGSGNFNGTNFTSGINTFTTGLMEIDIYSKSTLQIKKIEIVYKMGELLATADQQANAYADYLYTFRTCAADFADRKAIVTLVNEYNYMTQEAKDTFGSLAARTDEAGGNISCTPLEKLKLTVDQYNKKLETGETKLVLHISNTEDYSGMNDVSMINFENSTAIIIIVSISVLAISGIAIFAITRRKKLAK